MPEVDAPLEVEEPGGRRRVTLADLKGDQGDPGQDGAAGQDGADGADGAPGDDGLPRVVQEDGVDLPVRSKLNAGTGITAVDDAVNDRTTLSVESAVAADVPFTPSGTIGATDVQAAIEEVASEAPDLSLIAQDVVIQPDEAGPDNVALQVRGATPGEYAATFQTEIAVLDEVGFYAIDMWASEFGSNMTLRTSLASGGHSGIEIVALSDLDGNLLGTGDERALTVTGNTFKDGLIVCANGRTTMRPDQDVVPLTIQHKWDGGQTADLLNVLNASDAALLRIDKDGKLHALSGLRVGSSATVGHVLTATGTDGTVAFAAPEVTQAELDAEAAARAAADAALQPLDSDLTAIAALSPTNDDVVQRKAGAWTNRTPAQLKTDLALVKGDVGLGNVDNTSDANKPVSTAQQTALDLKANLASPTFTGTPAAPTAAPGTNTTQLATTAYVQSEAGLLVPKSLVDAAGDLLVATGDNTVDRLAIGTDGQVLTVDTSLAKKVRWATPSSSGIAASIMDAKGDLIVGTAADTAARKAVGTDGKALVADSTKSDGLDWAAPAPAAHKSTHATGGSDALTPADIAAASKMGGQRPARMITGSYYGPPSVSENSGGSFVLNQLYLVPFYVPVDKTFDRIGINVFGAATAGVVARLGIYLDDEVTGPHTLVLDASTVAIDSTGRKEATISQALTGGKLYWIGLVTQNAGASRGNISRVQGGATAWHGWANPNGYNSNFTLACSGFVRAGISGALPATLTPVRADFEFTVDMPYVWMRAA